MPQLSIERYIAYRIMKINMYIYLLNFFLISLCISQNSIKIKIGERYLDTDGLENIQQVIEKYEQKYKSSPMDFQIANDLGVVYLSADKYERALDHYFSLLPKFEFNRTGILLKICEAYEEMDEFEKSFNIIKHELEKCTKCSVFYLKLGNLCQKLELHKEAYQSYSQVDTTEVTPDYWFYYNYADVCFEADTTLEMGIKFAKRAIKLNPEWFVYKTLGDLLFRTKRYEEALNAYSVFVDEYPIPAVVEKIKILNSNISK